MTNATLDETEAGTPGSAAASMRGLRLALLAGFGLFAAAAGILSLRFGPDIFMDALTGLQGCF